MTHCSLFLLLAYRPLLFLRQLLGGAVDWTHCNIEVMAAVAVAASSATAAAATMDMGALLSEKMVRRSRAFLFSLLRSVVVASKT